jgi:hypothetical protein
MKRKLTLFVLSLSIATTIVMAQTDIDRTNWTVTTQTQDAERNPYGYMWDGGTKDAPVTGLPEHMFDGQTGSYLSLVKPGGSYGGITPPTDFTPSFIIDMQTAQEFDYIKWNHRYGSYGSVSGNNYNYLRVYGVVLEGSNDGADFTKIAPAAPAGTDPDIVWIPQAGSYIGGAQAQDDAAHTIPVAKSTYRYIKVNLTVQSKNYGTDEGKYQHPDDPGEGSTGGNTMQIAEFGLGLSGETGIEKIAVPGVTIAKSGKTLSIRLNGEYTGASVSVYSLVGLKLSETKATDFVEQTIDRQGIYLIQVKKNDKIFTSKVIL